MYSINLVNFLQVQIQSAPGRVRAVLLDLRVYQNLRSHRFGSTLLLMYKCPPFVRAPADAIESYAAAGCFSDNRILHTKRELRHFFPAAVLFYPLRPPPHSATHPPATLIPPLCNSPLPSATNFPRIHNRERLATQPSYHSPYTKNGSPRRGLPQIFRVGEITASQALFRRP